MNITESVLVSSQRFQTGSGHVISFDYEKENDVWTGNFIVTEWDSDTHQVVKKLIGSEVLLTQYLEENYLFPVTFQIHDYVSDSDRDAAVKNIVQKCYWRLVSFNDEGVEIHHCRALQNEYSDGVDRCMGPFCAPIQFAEFFATKTIRLN